MARRKKHTAEQVFGTPLEGVAAARGADWRRPIDDYAEVRPFCMHNGRGRSASAHYYKPHHDGLNSKNPSAPPPARFQRQASAPTTHSRGFTLWEANRYR